MTCLVFNLHKGEHIHFVDGSEGEFTAAAKKMKTSFISKFVRLPASGPHAVGDDERPKIAGFYSSVVESAINSGSFRRKIFPDGPFGRSSKK
jgi:hypothetical protein